MTVDNLHWRLENYKQRITTKQWREILMKRQDTIIFRGNVIKLKAKKLGAGVIEIEKDMEKINR